MIINSGGIVVEINQFVPEEKFSLNMLGLSFISDLDLGSYITSIAKTGSRKIGALILIILLNFFLQKLCSNAINMLFDQACNTAAKFKLVLQNASYTCSKQASETSL